MEHCNDVIASPAVIASPLLFADVAIYSLKRGNPGFAALCITAIVFILTKQPGLLRRKKAAPRNDAVQN